jgi:hypothetical protein
MGPLQSSYGTVILPRGTRLYHCSVNHLCTLPDKPVLFMTLHPSEYYVNDSHISVVELQRDVKLLFMVNMIYNMRIISALSNFLGRQNSNLNKQDYENIKKWLPYLQKENLDGWFCSIENKTTIEFAIKNDPSILKIIECDKFKYSWMNSKYTNDLKIIPKNWGTKYPISALTKPVKFILNNRFRPQIENYVNMITEEEPRGTAFSILLENANITYFDAPVKNIHWL